MFRFIKRFRRDEKGNLTVEAMFLMPVLAISFVLMYIIFDAIRQHTINQRAAYTISDMLSRETDYINPMYMDHAREMLVWLTSKHKRDVSLRVSVLRYDAQRDRYTVMWSKTRGPVDPHQNKDMPALKEKLPGMVDGEQVILTETWTDYQPPMNLGFLPREVRTFVFARPRFTPQLKWGGIGL